MKHKLLKRVKKPPCFNIRAPIALGSCYMDCQTMHHARSWMLIGAIFCLALSEPYLILASPSYLRILEFSFFLRSRSSRVPASPTSEVVNGIIFHEMLCNEKDFGVNIHLPEPIAHFITINPVQDNDSLVAQFLLIPSALVSWCHRAKITPVI